jgi:hypothetical protein
MTVEAPQVGIVDEAWINAAALHIACCEQDKFFCGASYHPEALAPNDCHEDDACPTCVDILYGTMCPPDRPATHFHCPIPGEHRKRCPK